MQRIEIAHAGYLPTYDECYVCGQLHPRGLRARFFAFPDGKVQVQFSAEPTQTGYEDVVHGGVISALLDELLGWPVVLQTGRMCFTAELTIRFLKPMRVGTRYVATAGPGSDRGRYWESAGALRDENGSFHAKAQGKFFLLSEDQTAAVVERMTYQPDDLPVFHAKLGVDGD
jgi:uncharacterized protein (TIGR00369 family)